MNKKRITVLGSTGSIGTQALDVAFRAGFPVVGLAANSSVKLLEEQARAFRSNTVCIYNKKYYNELKQSLADTAVKVVAGMEGLCEVAALKEADMTLNAVVGMIGLTPTLAAIAAGKEIALANKETLVTGGELVMRAASEKGVKILPVDSEHSAIFQALQGNSLKQVKSIFLTASGGPFYGYTKEQLEQVAVEDALKHPNWEMGAKITVDSATLMNKGLELIEAVRLFEVKASDVQIVVHRESVLHSAVEFDDHSVMAQLGVPDMRLPIQYALTWPDRISCPVERLRLTDYGRLTFSKADEETFVCLKACKLAIEQGGLMPAIVNGTNEEAVALFLEKKISFLDIGALVMESLHLKPPSDLLSLETILEADRMAREWVRNQTKGRS